MAAREPPSPATAIGLEGAQLVPRPPPPSLSSRSATVKVAEGGVVKRSSWTSRTKRGVGDHRHRHSQSVDSGAPIKPRRTARRGKDGVVSAAPTGSLVVGRTARGKAKDADALAAELAGTLDELLHRHEEARRVAREVGRKKNWRGSGMDVAFEDAAEINEDNDAAFHLASRRNRELLEQLDQAEDSLEEMRVWDAVLAEVIHNTAICKSKSLGVLLDRIRKRTQLMSTEVVSVFSTIRRRLDGEWSAVNLARHHDKVQSLAKDRLHALQEEVSREIMASEAFDDELEALKSSLASRRQQVRERLESAEQQHNERADSTTQVHGVRVKDVRTGDRPSGRLSFASKFFRFVLDSNDIGIVLHLHQEPAGTDEDYVELTIQPGEPPSRDHYMYLASTKDKESATLNLVDPGLRMQPGEWFVRVRGVGGSPKRFAFELEVKTSLMDVTAPLDDLLKDLEERQGMADQIGEHLARFQMETMRTAIEADRSRQVETATTETQTEMLDEFPALAVSSARSIKHDSLFAVSQQPQEPDESETEAAELQRDMELLAQSNLVRRFFRRPLRRAYAHMRELNPRVVLRMIETTYADRMVALARVSATSDAISPRPGTSKDRLQGFTEFVYQHFLHRFTKAKAAEAQLVTFLQSMRHEDIVSLPRVVLFRMLVRADPSAYTDEDADVYVQSLAVLKRQCALHSFEPRAAVSGPDFGITEVPLNVAIETTHEIFRRRSQMWLSAFDRHVAELASAHRRQRIAKRSMHQQMLEDEQGSEPSSATGSASHGERMICMDTFLRAVVDAAKEHRERFDSELRMLFDMGTGAVDDDEEEDDDDDESTMTLTQLQHLVRSTRLGISRVECTAMYWEGVHAAPSVLAVHKQTDIHPQLLLTDGGGNSRKFSFSSASTGMLSPQSSQASPRSPRTPGSSRHSRNRSRDLNASLNWEGFRILGHRYKFVQRYRRAQKVAAEEAAAAKLVAKRKQEEAKAREEAERLKAADEWRKQLQERKAAEAAAAAKQDLAPSQPRARQLSLVSLRPVVRVAEDADAPKKPATKKRPKKRTKPRRKRKPTKPEPEPEEPKPTTWKEVDYSWQSVSSVVKSQMEMLSMMEEGEAVEPAVAADVKQRYAQLKATLETREDADVAMTQIRELLSHLQVALGG